MRHLNFPVVPNDILKEWVCQGISHLKFHTRQSEIICSSNELRMAVAHKVTVLKGHSTGIYKAYFVGKGTNVCFCDIVRKSACLPLFYIYTIIAQP